MRLRFSEDDESVGYSDYSGIGEGLFLPQSLHGCKMVFFQVHWPRKKKKKGRGGGQVGA